MREEWNTELHRILHWWMEQMVDEENGGFYGRRDVYGKLYPQAAKGVILNTRILWSFATAARMFEREDYAATATRAYHYLCDHFLDSENGGVFWMLDYQGKPLETKKQVYAQSFAIYGLSEYYLLTGNKEAKELAREIFSQLEAHSYDIDHGGGYLEAFDRNWGPLEDVRLSNKDQNAAKTMNTHLHVLEAYTHFYRVVPDLIVRKALEGLIRIFLDKFIEPATGHLHLFFDDRWNRLSDEISFGHDIEASWLLMEAAEVLGNESLLEEVKSMAQKMVDVTLEKGVDPESGALWNESGPNGHIDRNHHWWPQVEAMVGCLNAWQIDPQNRYLDACARLWDYCKRELIDDEAGEWHWGKQPDGSLMLHEDKAGPWKGPYHHTRALMEGLGRLR